MGERPNHGAQPASAPRTQRPAAERAASRAPAGLGPIGPAAPLLLTHPAIGGRGNGALRQATLLHLQRTQGNRAVQRALRAHPAAAPARPPAPVRVQRTLSRGTGTGWGLIGWKDDKAKGTWEELDRKFNTELFARKKELEDLQAGYADSEAKGHFKPSLDAITAVLDEWDNKSVEYTKAPALITKLDDIGKDAETAKTEAARIWGDKLTAKNDRVNDFLARVGDALTGLKIDFKAFPPMIPERRAIKTELERARDTAALLDKAQIQDFERRITAIEKSFREAASKTRQAAAAKESARKLKEAQEAAEQQDVEAQRKLRESLKAKLGANYSRLLGLSGESNETLAAFVARVPTITHLNRILGAVGKDRADDVEALLAVAKPGEDEQLAALLEATHGDVDNDLPDVLAKVGPASALPLVKQRDDDAAAVAELLKPAAVKGPDVAALLATPSKGDTAFLLEKVPDSAFLVQLEATVADPLELRLLAHDLAGKQAESKVTKAATVRAAKDLFARPHTVTSKADVYAAAGVAKARGLKTNAGATIATVRLADLGGTKEKVSVEATLKHIRGGPQPTLSHDNGAKFGDPFDNNQGRLPGVAGAGGYKEYYVEKDPADVGTYHGSRRLVAGTQADDSDPEHIYYTADHYASFRRLLA